jgi:hypothetical protein
MFVMVLLRPAPFFAQEDAVTRPVSFVVAADYDQNTRANADMDLALMRDLEVHGWTGHVRWAALEPAAGRTDFAWLQQFATLAASYGIELHPIVDGTPAWAAQPAGDRKTRDMPPAKAADWQRFASALGAALAGHDVASYAFYERPDDPDWWGGTPEDYAQVLITAAASLRTGTPAPSIAVGSLSASHWSWVQQMCAAGAGRAFDALQLEIAAETPSEPVEDSIQDLPAFAGYVDRACGRKRIWIDAAVAPTAAGRSERDQAAAWVRAIATFAAEPRVEQIAIHSARDRAASPGTGDVPANHDGLARADGTRKVSFYTIDLLTDLLGTAPITLDDRQLRLTPSGPADDLHAHLFTRNDGDRVLILWNRTASTTVAAEVPGIASSVEFDLDGRPLHWDPKAVPLASLALSPGVPRIFRLAPST